MCKQVVEARSVDNVVVQVGQLKVQLSASELLPVQQRQQQQQPLQRQLLQQPRATGSSLISTSYDDAGPVPSMLTCQKQTCPHQHGTLAFWLLM